MILRSHYQSVLFISIVMTLFLAACSGSDEAEEQEEIGTVETASIAPTSEPVTFTPEPVEPTPLPPTPTFEASTSTPAAPTSTPEPTQTPVPEPTVPLVPIIPLGSTADLTSSADVMGIDGLAEVIDLNKIKINDFVSVTGVAPGVDIRLGQDGDFSDEVAVVLKDITGDDYQGRSLTLTIPHKAFDGRLFDSIAIYCFATGEIFDWVMFDFTQSDS